MRAESLQERIPNDTQLSLSMYECMFVQCPWNQLRANRQRSMQIYLNWSNSEYCVGNDGVLEPLDAGYLPSDCSLAALLLSLSEQTVLGPYQNTYIGGRQKY